MVWKKVAVLLDFVQITSTPPPQNLDNLYHFFLTPTCQKKMGRGVPLPPHPQINPIYTPPCPRLKWTSEHEAMVEDQLRRSSGLSTEGLGGDGGEEEGDIIWMIQT